MTTVQFLSSLRSKDIKLWVEHDKLCYDAPAGALTPDLRAELAERKGEILEVLRSSSVITSPIVPVARDKDLPLSFAQERLWFLDQLEPPNSSYNIPAAFRLNGSLDVKALERGLNEIISRHEVLRTTFTAVNGQPYQVIAPFAGWNLPVVNLETVPEGEREAQADNLVKEETGRPFDLQKGPLCRASLLRLSEKDHILIITLHHIVSDGWSMRLFFEELSVLYEAFSNGKPSPLPALSAQYADFAVWQRKKLEEKALKTQASYWREQLKDIPGSLELPTDRPRSAIQSFRGARQFLDLPKNLTTGLRSISRGEGATLFMILLAAFKTLLFRYAGQPDILVGIPITNRNRTEIERLIGFFVNNVVVRTDLSGNPTFQELLGRVREAALGAYAHQDLPFEKLVEELQPRRDLSRSPLFQVMFTLQSIVSQPAKELTGLTVTPMNVDTGSAKFDLTLSLVDLGDSLKGAMEYNTHLFADHTINRMLNHFCRLLESIVANPDQRLSDLPIMPETERGQLLVKWNKTTKDFPADKCIHSLFEAQVGRCGESTAVAAEEKELTYDELNCRSNQLANYLCKSGVGPEVLVGVCMERGWEMVVAVLAVLKAGGAYVPLDPAYPRARLAYMLEDAGISVLLTQERLLKVLPEHGARVICLDAEWKTIARESSVNPDSGVRPENLAYVIYTSGSTGRPKGVQIPHRAVVNFLNAMRVRPGLTEQDVLVAVTTLSFDIAGLELFLPLAVGARVVVVTSAVAADGPRLLKVLERTGATIMQATPATWRLLLEAGWQPGGQLKILCGGEALTRELANKLLERASSVWNMYGPTETTIWSATSLVRAGEDSISVGGPIDNTQIYIVDSYLNPVPIGVSGELCIGGVGLARGYKNRPELVAEKFIPDPFSDHPGGRLYRTGDLARYLANGTIEVLGRIDYQIKMRGFRIELGEIESVVSQHPAVKQVVVVDREIAGERRLIGYIVANGKGSPTSEDLRNFLRKKLPEYMVPLAFVPLESLPLTPNGKVDRRSLPGLDGIKVGSENGFIAARNSIELQLASVWERVLGVSPIGMRDNFFDLGGYSLLAVRLFAEIEKFLGKKLPLATLFQAPTIEQLANLFRQEDWSPSWSSLVAIQPEGAKPPFFCVHAHGGNVLNFNSLARCLGRDQPFYGLQAQGLDGEQPRHTSVEEMATHYIKEIRGVQPHGPYLLGGYCFGGKVAYEMAKQLQAQGERVSLLAMIDAFAPGYRTLLPWGLRRLAQIKHHWKNIQARNREEKLAYVLEKTALVHAIIQKHARTMAAKCILRLGISLPQALEGALQKRAPRPRAYSPKVYPGKITIFAPTDSHSRYHRFESHLGWKSLAGGGLEIHEIPGRVASIIVEPYVLGLAKELESCIEEASAMKSNENTVD